MSKEELLEFENKLNFGIETRDGTFYVPKDDAVKAASELLDKLAPPQLSIPKHIAEELLEGDITKHPSYELMFCESGDWSEELQEWMETTDKWWAIVDAYLASKALGVELVEVVG